MNLARKPVCAHVTQGRMSRCSAALLLLLGATTAPLPGDASVCEDPGNENTQAPATTPTIDFELHDDGTVTHLPTGLMWLRCTDGQTWNGVDKRCEGGAPDAFDFAWDEALRRVRAINEAGGGAAGYTDWRLPNRNELESIVELRCHQPAINAEVFPDTIFPPDNNERYWTSTPYITTDGSSSRSWSLNFANGEIENIPRTSPSRIRLVRDTSGDDSERP